VQPVPEAWHRNAAKNTTLSTTFSGTPTTTGGTIGSATGLAIGDPVLINIAAGRVRGELPALVDDGWARRPYGRLRCQRRRSLVTP
jgi:hypothetical protein